MPILIPRGEGEGDRVPLGLVPAEDQLLRGNKLGDGRLCSTPARANFSSSL